MEVDSLSPRRKVKIKHSCSYYLVYTRSTLAPSRVLCGAAASGGGRKIPKSRLRMSAGGQFSKGECQAHLSPIGLMSLYIPCPSAGGAASRIGNAPGELPATSSPSEGGVTLTKRGSG